MRRDRERQAIKMKSKKSKGQRGDVEYVSTRPGCLKKKRSGMMSRGKEEKRRDKKKARG